MFYTMNWEGAWDKSHRVLLFLSRFRSSWVNASQSAISLWSGHLLLLLKCSFTEHSTRHTFFSSRDLPWLLFKVALISAVPNPLSSFFPNALIFIWCIIYLLIYLFLQMNVNCLRVRTFVCFAYCCSTKIWNSSCYTWAQ
jgi:hypothetical protein